MSAKGKRKAGSGGLSTSLAQPSILSFFGVKSSTASPSPPAPSPATSKDNNRRSRQSSARFKSQSSGQGGGLLRESPSPKPAVATAAKRSKSAKEDNDRVRVTEATPTCETVTLDLTDHDSAEREVYHDCSREHMSTTSRALKNTEKTQGERGDGEGNSESPDRFQAASTSSDCVDQTADVSQAFENAESTSSTKSMHELQKERGGRRGVTTSFAVVSGADDGEHPRKKTPPKNEDDAKVSERDTDQERPEKKGKRAAPVTRVGDGCRQARGIGKIGGAGNVRNGGAGRGGARKVRESDEDSGEEETDKITTRDPKKDGEGDADSDSGSSEGGGGQHAGENDSAREFQDDARQPQRNGVKVNDEAKRKVGNEDEETIMEAATGISEYELQRLERIRKNQAFMATLGLDNTKPPPSLATTTTSGGCSVKKKKRGRPVSRVKERATAVPVRRSLRARGGDAIHYSEDKLPIVSSTTPEPEPEPDEEELDFDDSTVLQYLCSRDDNTFSAAHQQQPGKNSAEDEAANRRSPRDEGKPSAAGQTGDGDVPSQEPYGENNRKALVGLRLLDRHRPLSAPGLSTIYTMHFADGGRGVGGAPPLLAAGGKGGVVALFSTQAQTEKTSTKEKALDSDDEDDERTLMNFKAHKGWVSAVRFLDNTAAGSGADGDGSRGAGHVGAGIAGCRLLSSANDSVVKLWDLSKQHAGVPRLLSTSDDLHPTCKGIFSMDTYGTKVATGSKDTTVAIASLTPAGVAFDRVLGAPGGCEAFHEKVVKGVDLRDEHTVASCGDDSNVRVTDLRDSSSGNFGVSHRLDGVHDGPCHTVRWHPSDAHLLLTAGLDSTVKLHDLRRPGVAVFMFRGHCPHAIARPRAIHRPEFITAGDGVGSGGSDRFSLVTCGEKSDKISMYNAGTGATVSRGLLGAEASALAVGGRWRTSMGTGVIAAAIPGGDVVLLGPVWGPV